MTSQHSVQWFDPTSGRITGWLGVALGVIVVGLAFVDGFSIGVAAAGALLALVCWLAMLRPRVGLTSSEVVLRGLLSTTWLPLAAVESVRARQVLAVWVAGKRYVSAAVGHRYRDIARARRRASLTQAPADLTPPVADQGAAKRYEIAYADHVVDTVTDRAREAREQAGVRARSAEQAELASGVHRSWAWPEIAALALLLAALVAAVAI